MRPFRTFITSLIVVLLATTAVAAAESTVRDEVAVSVAPASERVAAVSQPQPGDSNQCTYIRDSISERLANRRVNTDRFVDDLTAQIAERPGLPIIAQIELMDAVSLADAVELGMDEVSVTSVGIYFGQSVFSIQSAPVDSVEAHVDRILDRMDSFLVFVEEGLEYEKSVLEREKKKGDAARVRRARKQVARAERDIARMRRVRESFTPDTVVVHGVQLEGAPAAILEYLGSERVHTARLVIEPALLPSVIEQVMELKDRNETEAITWIENHDRAAKQLRGRVFTPFSERTLRMAERACAQ